MTMARGAPELTAGFTPVWRCQMTLDWPNLGVGAILGAILALDINTHFGSVRKKNESSFERSVSKAKDSAQRMTTRLTAKTEINTC